jgi:hypothetical protein
MNKVLGSLESNSFIRQEKENLAAFKKDIEALTNLH